MVNMKNETSFVSVEKNGDGDQLKEVALEKRKQPLFELVYSEECYVRRLRIAYELYMPAPYRSSNVPLSGASSPISSIGTGVGTSLEELAGKLPPGGPAVPDDLVARWRILWGNWLQLLEWHASFYEQLKTLADEDPERIPKLFIDSKTRLRSIYSKYCENQIKAAHIAEQHKEFFDEWRQHVSDKEDVVSLLMQPIQRIMRYQLPMTQIVKYTERACLSSLTLWQRALDMMKEIPKDTQLILEAARIDGFPGVITALGTLRIRGDLLVGSLTRTELSETIRAYARSLHLYPPVLISQMSSPSSEFFESSCAQNKLGDSDERLEPTAGETPTLITPTPLTYTRSLTGGLGAQGFVTGDAEAAPWLAGGQKFVMSRLFLFDRMLLVTEEVKPKRKGTSADAFAQSTFQFRAAVNVNQMRFEPSWYSCNVVANTAQWAKIRSTLEVAASDDLRFALWDKTPGRDVIYVIDPQTVATRSAWVVHLRDIQRMQQQLLMALEDPTRFSSNVVDEQWASSSGAFTTEDVFLPEAAVKEEKIHNQSSTHRKWPSFTKRRQGRLAYTASTPLISPPVQCLPPNPPTERNRRPPVKPGLGSKERVTVDAPSHPRSISVERRLNASSDRNKVGKKVTRITSDSASFDADTYEPTEYLTDTADRDVAVFHRTRKTFLKLFGGHSKKNHSKPPVAKNDSRDPASSNAHEIQPSAMTVSCHASIDDEKS